MSSPFDLIYFLHRKLATYGSLPEDAVARLEAETAGDYYPTKTILCAVGQTYAKGLYVSDGYLACYSLNSWGDRQLVGLYGRDELVLPAGSVTGQPSAFEWCAVRDSYLLSFNQNVLAGLSPALPSLLLAARAEQELEFGRFLRLSAAHKVGRFYQAHSAFSVPGYPLPDADVAAYLGIGESTLRRERLKLFNTS